MIPNLESKMDWSCQRHRNTIDQFLLFQVASYNFQVHVYLPHRAYRYCNYRIASYINAQVTPYSFYAMFITLHKQFNKNVNLAPVVQRPDNFIRWIRLYSGSKIYFTLNVVHGFLTLPNLAVVRVCIFACKRGNTEIFAQIETVG